MAKKENDDELAPLPLFIIPPPAPVFATKLTKLTFAITCQATNRFSFASPVHLWYCRCPDMQGYLDFLKVWATIVRNETAFDQSKLPKTFEHQPEHFFENVKPNAPPTEIPRGFVVLPSPP